MKAETWTQNGLWYWHILDEYGDELACANSGFETRVECREELHAALEDWSEQTMNCQNCGDTGYYYSYDGFRYACEECKIQA